MSKDQDDAVVQFSARLAEALTGKMTEHNSSCPNNKVYLGQVVKVYKHGTLTFPHDALAEIGINKWSMARVNMFLRMKCGQISRGKAEEIVRTKKMSSLIFEKNVVGRVNTFLDVTESWLPAEEDFIQAQEDVEENDLNYDFKHSDEIYFNEGGAFEVLYE